MENQDISPQIASRIERLQEGTREILVGEILEDHGQEPHVKNAI